MKYNNFNSYNNNNNNYGSYNNYNNGNYNNNGYRPSGRFVQKMAQFMMGRYGYDQLSKFINILAIILILLSNFKGLHILNAVGLLLFGIATFRIYSRNIYKRQQENVKYLQMTRGIRTKIRDAKIKREAKRSGKANKAGRGESFGGQNYSNVYQGDFSHTYLRCGCCGKELRVPKGVGTVDVTCPACRAKTRVKS